jgi:hypothetical protein
VIDGIRFECQSASGRCLTTNYVAAANGNTFTGFADPCDKTDSSSQCAMRPLACQ